MPLRCVSRCGGGCAEPRPAATTPAMACRSCPKRACSSEGESGAWTRRPCPEGLWGWPTLPLYLPPLPPSPQTLGTWWVAPPVVKLPQQGILGVGGGGGSLPHFPTRRVTCVLVVLGRARVSRDSSHESCDDRLPHHSWGCSAGTGILHDLLPLRGKAMASLLGAWSPPLWG